MKAVLLTPICLAPPAMAQCGPEGWVTGFANFSTNSQVYALTVLPDGDVVAGGTFTAVAGTTIPAPNKFARYDFDTGTWTTPATGTNGSTVHALATLSDGDILLGGNFTSIGGVATRQLARYDFGTNTFSGLGYGNNGGQVDTILVLPDNNTVIIGGNFFRVGGILVNHCARLNLSTGVWSTMNSNMASTGDRVHSLALAPDGTVIVGGSFLSAGGSGVAASRIARYNPSTGAWSTLGSGTNGVVNAVGVLPNGDVIAAGTFTIAGGATAGQVARFDSTTGVWSNMAGGISGAFDYVNTLTVLPSGDVVIGGSFTVAGGVPAARIARYDPDTNTWFPLGAGVNNDVEDIRVLPEGDIVAGGFFTGVGSRIARYTFGCPACPCPADFDASGGTPDAGDVDAFFTAWLVGDTTADADCSGGTPDAGDVDAFFIAWLAGGC
jgi:trimeric autotransporter adhesin